MSAYGLTAKQLAEHLQTQELGTTGEDLFYSFLPDSPDNCISIFDTGGWPKDPDLPRKDVTFQFRIRGEYYDEAQALAETLYNYFCPEGIPKKLFYLDSLFVQLVQPMQPVPYHLGRDENGRDEFAWNMTFIIR